MRHRMPTPIDRIDCHTCQTELAAYVRQELDKRMTAEIDLTFTSHLEACPKCQTAYFREFRQQGSQKSIIDLQQLGERYLTAPFIQQIVSFLQPDPTWREALVTQSRIWKEKETDRWRRLWLTLPALDRIEAKSASTVGWLKSETRSHMAQQETLIFRPTEAHFELKAAITPELAATTAESYCLEVAVIFKDRFGDFSGTEIVLFWGSAIHKGMTDILGKVSFSGLRGDWLPTAGMMVVLPD